MNSARASRKSSAAPPTYHLLTDGTHLYLETSARQIVDILKNSSQPILGVCLSDAVRQVRAEVDRPKSEYFGNIAGLAPAC